MRVLQYLPASARGYYWAAVRRSAAATSRVVKFRSLSARATAARAWTAPPAYPIDKSSGFSVFGPGAVPAADGVVQAAQQLVAAQDASQLDFSRKQQLTNLLKRNDHLDLASPLLQFALDDRVIKSISDYLGMVPILTYIGVWYSRSVDGKAYSSDLYHLDGEAPSQVKVFVHCSDVGPDNGPLTVIGARTSERLNRMLHYGWRGGRVPDETVQRLIGDEDQHPLVGPPGTVAFVDTDRCFHFGSRVQKNAAPRLVTTFQFLTPLSMRLFRTEAAFRRLAAPDLPKLQRLVLGEE